MPLQNAHETVRCRNVVVWNRQQQAVRTVKLLSGLLERDWCPDRAVLQAAVPMITNGIHGDLVERCCRTVQKNPGTQTDGDRHASRQSEPLPMVRSLVSR